MDSHTYETVILGERPGYVALAFGIDPYRDESGTYRHREWSENAATRYSWPDQAETLRADIARETAAGARDVYICPAVRFTRARRRGDALPPLVCWADLDDEPADGDLYTTLDPYVVASGQAGHRHIYVPLTEPVPLSAHAALNKALAARLGGDAKWSDESLLRLPGTSNHKTDPPAPVVAEAETWGGAVWAPGDLAALLGVSVGDELAERHNGDSAGGNRHLAAVSNAPEPETPPDPLPSTVRRALEHPETRDRSVAHARLVGAAYDAGLTRGQTYALTSGYGPSIEKYGDRVREETGRWWDKLHADHAQPAPVTPIDGTSALAPAAVTSADPSAFFDKDTGVRIARLAGAVEAHGPVATDDAGRLYRYSGGAWFGDGERVATARVARLTGDRYRRSHATNVLDVLRTREPVFTDTALDTEHLNVPNGLLHWRTATLHPHTPDVANLTRIPIDWHPDATCPVIHTWLEDVFGADVVPFIYEVIGYALYNDNPLHLAILCYGRGRNGKGTFLRLLQALIGAGNTSSVTPQSLDEDRFRAAELHGKLANLVGDVDPKAFKATETFKQITGGDRITAERKYGQPFSFTCRALMVAAFNQLPRTTDTSEGFFSRWLVVPFTAHFPEGAADSSIEGRMHAPGELQGLLVQAVAGLQRVMARRAFNRPAAVEAATRDFRQTADPVRAFLTESTTADRDAWLPKTSLYSDWQRWTEQHGHHSGSANAFYERVEAAALELYGYPLEARKRRGTRGYLGCRLTRWDEL